MLIKYFDFTLCVLFITVFHFPCCSIWAGFSVMCIIDPTNVECCVLLVLQMFGNRMLGVVNLANCNV